MSIESILQNLTILQNQDLEEEHQNYLDSIQKHYKVAHVIHYAPASVNEVASLT